MLEGYRVRFVSVMQLIQELQLAQTEYRLPRFLRSWNKYDLVILDELGYVPLGEGGKLLFQFISQRYEQSSLIITSNLEFSRWVDVFGDPALTTALLDRLTHHSHILLFDGDSYRFRQRLRGAERSIYRMETRVDVWQLRDGIDEMEATIERLSAEIRMLKEQRDALTQGNLALYHDLTRVDF